MIIQLFLKNCDEKNPRRQIVTFDEVARKGRRRILQFEKVYFFSKNDYT